MVNTEDSGNDILTNDEWDRLLDSLDIEQMEKNQAEATLRVDEYLRVEYKIPQNEEVKWETLCSIAQKQDEKNREIIQDVEEQQRQMRDAHEREMFILKLYQKQGPKRMEE